MTSESTLIRPFRQHGDSGDMVRLALVNLGLNIVTLSFWRFWGRTRVRRLLWGTTTAWDDPVDYTGTGKELLKGFLMALVVVYLPLVAGILWAQSLVMAEDPLGPLLMSVLYILTALLVAAGTYRARRYQLSRTVWRGIRGGQGGSALVYAGITLLVWIVVPLSLGWALPWGEMKLARYRLGHTRFGDRSFSCDAGAGGMYRYFAVVWLSGLALLGMLWLLALSPVGEEGIAGINEGSTFTGSVLLSLLLLLLPWAWYRAAFYRRLAAGTSFGGHRFSAAVATWPIVRLAVGNGLISLLSLGVLRPWAALRTFRFTCSVMALDGVPDFATIHQTTQAGPSMGEGVMTVLDGAGEF